MKINDMIYESIKESLLYDMQLAYEVFKEEGYENLRGVKFCINSSSGFSEYLRKNPDKLADLSEHLFSNLDFDINLLFVKNEFDEFYPLMD